MKNIPRVCMVVHQPYDRDSRVRRYAEALSGTGAQVDIICMNEQRQSPVKRIDGIRVYPAPFRRIHSNNRYFVIIEYAIVFVTFTVQLLFLHLRNRYHVIHVHNIPDFLVFVATIPKIFGARVILDIHDPMPELFMSKYGKQISSSIVNLLGRQEKLSTSFADAVITANRTFKANLIKRGTASEKITVVRNIPDPKIFNRANRKSLSERDDGFFTLIYPGTIAPRYGLEVAIRALPALAAQIPELRLIIMGPHDQHSEYLMELARQLDVDQIVTIRPPVTLEEVPSELIKADIGIYTAIRDPHMNIAIPTKVLEYAAMGIPTVAPRLDVLLAAFPDKAIMYFEPGSVEGFAECITLLYKNPHRREELVREMDETFFKDYTTEEQMEIYFDLLKRLLPEASFTS